jgi:hypothetical protein
MIFFSDWTDILDKANKVAGLSSIISTICTIFSLIIAAIVAYYKVKTFRQQRPNVSTPSGLLSSFFRWRYVAPVAAVMCLGFAYFQSASYVDHPTVAKKPVRSLPTRARLKVSGIEFSPPAKDAWVRVKAFVGEDTFIFPSTGTNGWLPASGTWNGQSIVFAANPPPTIQFEVSIVDRQSGHESTLLGTDRIPYKGESTKDFYNASGADSTAPNASGIRRAHIAYQLQPVF